MTTESLTIRIQADSSQFQQELASVVQQVTAVADRFRQVADAQNQMARGTGGIQQSTTAMQALARAADQVLQRLNRLNNTTIRLNVTPALNALQSLSQAIAAVSAQLQTLTVPGAIPFAPPSVPRTRASRFASGGLVTGPPGLDRIPALLTAGEFVIRQEAAQAIGVDQLQRLNQTAPVPAAEPASNVHHDYGGITIQVARAADVNDIVRDLQFQGFHLRTRRG